jgi:hypothetical protein
MRKVTLTVVAVLLAVPAFAQAKAGIEFTGAIEQQQPGSRQDFSAIAMREPPDPAAGAPSPIVGAQPLVTFQNTKTGQVIRVRTSPTNRNGVGFGSVTFPNRGPWTASMAVGGKPFAMHASSFSLQAAAPPASGPAAVRHDNGGGGGFPAWPLSIPAAGLAAFAFWFLRRRPREVGA